MRVSVLLVLLGRVVFALRMPPADGLKDRLGIWPRNLLSGASDIYKIDAARKACPEINVTTYETWITSIGGSGTTSIIEELAKVQPSLYLNHEGDCDGIKHRPFGKVDSHNLKKLKRILYVYGDITHAILSLHRRGWLNVQAGKVRSKGPWKAMTLEEYAEAEGDELFQVDEHLHSFKNQCKYDIAFLNITQKASHIPELAAFLEVPEDQLQQHLRRWQFSEHVENMMLKQKDYSEFTEGEYVQELLGFEARNLRLMKNRELMEKDPGWQSHYNEVPAWVIEALQKKFAGTMAEMQNLGGLHIQKATCAES